ncbi:MAG: polysaccharide pyruvyl transferase CsaB [Bacillota bacterium]
MSLPYRIVISGYVGFGNVGDEAILTATVRELRSVLPDVELVVLSANPAATSRQHGVASVHRLHPLPALLRSDLLLFGGGGLLQDYTSQRSLLYYLGIITTARLLGKRTMVYANSIGPVLRPSSARLVRLVLNGVDAITVRDRASADELSRLGVSGPPVAVTADPALLLPAVDEDQGRAFCRAQGIDPDRGPVVAISIRPWRTQGYVEGVARLADHLAQAHGAQVVFFPVQPGQDGPVLRQTASLMEEPSRVLSEDIGLQGVLSLLSVASLAVGMRLHALIFSLVQATPAMGIIYDPKVEHFLTDTGMPSLGTASAFDAAAAAEAVDRLWPSLPERRRELQAQREAARARARENVDWVARLLQSEGRGHER